STATTEHPVTDDPECMKAITVDSVWQTYEEVMEKRNDRLN
ncbi:MAG: lipopolysaccharide heptosyltransferase, partial [Megasphaera micronuciformis]|nr:lipopolysaccharide heptosyltransferase [Megasphaera micronuciformis]